MECAETAGKWRDIQYTDFEDHLDQFGSGSEGADYGGLFHLATSLQRSQVTPPTFFFQNGVLVPLPVLTTCRTHDKNT